MKILVLLLLMILSVDNFHAQESQEISEDFENHAFRMYGSIGTGWPFVNVGLGLSYVYEVGNLGKKRDVFFGFSSDIQTGFTQDSWVTFNIQTFNIQFALSVGKRYQNGSRFSYDLIGVGLGMFYDYSESLFTGDLLNLVLNFFSFHYTSSNGFYFSWRNNLMTPTTEGNIFITKFVEYRTYFTIGFDFSKIYNPKIYRERSF